MREEEILTLQSAVELDRIHNDGKLFRALKAGHISKEEMISSTLSIVQKKNAQIDTQKLLFQIESNNTGIVGDYWEREKPTIKEKIISMVLYDKNGEFNIDNLKKFGMFLSVVGLGGYFFMRKGFTNISNYFKKKASRKEYLVRQRKQEELKKIKIHYKNKLDAINQILENEELSDEDRSKYEEMKEYIINLLNNNDNSVGDIVEIKDVE